MHGEPDRTFAMDSCFWVLRSPAGCTTHVDCGFASDVGRRQGRQVLVDPVDAPSAPGVGAVDRILVSHAHYDHIGNLARLPGDPDILMALLGARALARSLPAATATRALHRA